MDELFLMAENTKYPLSEAMIRKYNLKKGKKSPFSNAHIVDINGDSTVAHKEKAEITDVEESQIIFDQSEILG